MTISEMALLATAGFGAGVLNAVAGGGTIFTFSALLAIGVPPVAANATSATAMVMGSTASAIAYRRELAAEFRRLLPLCAISMIGGGLGGALLLWSGDHAFRALVPWLLLFATVLFALARPLQKLVQARAALRPNGEGPDLALPAQGLVSIYGGYFGAGMGVMMLASLSLSRDNDYHAVNAAKNLLSIVLQAVAAIVFLVSGLVDLKLSLLLAVASILAGWSGVAVARRIPETLVRSFVIVSGFALTIWYFVT